MTGEQIRKLRDALGMSQRQLAELLDISQAQVSRIEDAVEPRSGPIKIVLRQIATDNGLLHLVDNKREKGAVSQ